MARTVTLLQLRTRALRRADMATSGFVTAAEVTDLVNDELPEVYRQLVACGPPDYYSASQSYTTSGVAQALPADFFEETMVYALVSSTYRRPLVPVTDWALSGVQPAVTGSSIVMEYIPTPALLAADGDTFDGVAGWDSLLTCRVARRLLQKRKQDSSSVDAEISVLTQELRSQARRSKGPRYMRDVSDADGRSWQTPSQAAVSGYRIRGANIEFWQPILAYP